MKKDYSYHAVFSAALFCLAIFLMGRSNDAGGVVVVPSDVVSDNCGCNCCGDKGTYKVEVPQVEHTDSSQCVPYSESKPSYEVTKEKDSVFGRPAPNTQVIHTPGTYAIGNNIIINTYSGKVVATRKKGGSWEYSEIYGTKEEFTPYKKPNQRDGENPVVEKVYRT